MKARGGDAPRRLAAGLVLAIALVGPAAAQKRDPQPRVYRSEKEKARLVVDDAWPPVGPGLVYPVRVTIENTGSKRRFEVEWVGKGTPDRVVRRIELDEGQRARFTMLVPRAGTHYTSRLAVRIDGGPVPDLADETNWFDLDTQPRLSPGRIRGRGILVVDGTKPDLREFESHFPTESSCLVVLSPDRLSEDWQAYDGLRIVLVRASLWRSLPPEASRAIQTAVRAGGTILFYGDPAEGLPPAGDWGQGEVQHVRGDPFEPGSSGWLGRRDRWLGRSLAEREMRVPGVDSVPLLALKLILLVFVLLVGPVNLFVTWYVLKNRPLLLVTTPVLAIVGSVLLFAWSFASEGFGVRSTTVSWTWLDPDSNEAVLRRESALYAGLAPGDGLVFDPDTALWAGDRPSLHESAPATWAGSDHGRYARNPDDRGPTFEIDQSEGLAVRSGALPARRMSWMSGGRVLEVRSRIAVEAGGPTGRVLVNGLPVAIRAAWIALGGKRYLVLDEGELAAGGRGNLATTPTLSWGRHAGIPGWMTELVEEPGEYVLVLESNPWLELGLEGVDAEGDLHVASGRVALP